MAASARLTVRRVSVARSLRQASPLLLDALTVRSTSLGDVLDRLLEASTDDGSWQTALHSATAVWRHHVRGGNVAAPWSRGDLSAPLTLAPAEGLHLVWAADRLDVRGMEGRLRIATVGACAWLWIGDALPETLAIAAVNRPVDALLDHPLLTGRGYQVLRVEPERHRHGGTMLQVATGLRRCRTPWTPQAALEAGCATMSSIMSGAG